MTFTVELRESADTTNSHYPHHRLQCPSNGVQTSQVPQSRALVCLGGNVRLLPHCRHVRVIHRFCQDLQDISRAEQVHDVPAPAGGPARPPGPGGASCHDAGRLEDGLEIGLVTGVFLSVTQSLSVIRNSINPLDYAAGGLAMGAVYRFNMGPRGMVGAGMAGAIYGLGSGLIAS